MEFINTDENGNRISFDNWWVTWVTGGHDDVIAIVDYNDIIRYWMVKIKHSKTGMTRDLKVKYDFTILP